MTEDVAVENQLCTSCAHEHPVVVCSMADIEPGEHYDGIMTVNIFSFFGYGFFVRQVGDVRPWLNPHDKGLAQ